MATTVIGASDGDGSSAVNPPLGAGVSALAASSSVLGRAAAGAAAGGGASYAALEALGCVAFWPLTEGSGTVATDVIGGADGTYVGATHGSELVTGAGSAASFDGVDDYIDIFAIGNLLEGSTAITLEGTFNFNADPVSYIISLTESTLASLYMIYHNSADTLRGNTNWGDGTDAQAAVTSVDYDNVTKHGVLVWELVGGNEELTLYVDGVAVASDTQTATSTFPAITQAVIGANNGLTSFAGGRISHVGIYNRALSASEVTDRYNNRAPEDAPPPYPNLDAMGCVAFWPLTEGSGEVATDVIGGADGTYVGATHGAELVAGAGSAANFDGVNDYITLTAMFSMQDSGLGDAFSVEVTFQGLDEGRDFSLVDMRDGAGDPVDGFAIHLDPANTIDGHRFHDTGNVELNAATPWKSVTRHAVLTYSQATGTLTLYIDGVSQVVDNTTASLDNSSVFSPSENNRLGISGAGGGLFKGRMSHVGVYNKELTASEVTDRYNNRAPT